jgi:hypothetical protein
MSNYEITPKLKFFQNGALLKTKKPITAQRHPGVTEIDTNMLFDKDAAGPIVIPTGTALLYVDNKQFYSSSKEFGVAMSAWIRAEVVSPLGERLWVTLLQERKTIWDFKTYTGKKQLLDNQVNENFMVLSVQSPNNFYLGRV